MQKEIDIAKINEAAWDAWSQAGNEWTLPLSHEAFMAAKQAPLEIYLTPGRPIPQDWYPPLEGAEVLGLASGGGQQLPRLTAKGAKCTLFDNSSAQIAAEQLVAEREGFEIKTIKGNMMEALPFEDASFDFIINPVSTCYIQEVEPLWRECYRLLKPGGVLMTGFSLPVIYLFDDPDKPVEEVRVKNQLPYDPVKLAQSGADLEMDWGSVQFSHSLETQLNGQLKAGLTLTDILEDTYPDSPLGAYIPLFMLTRAVKA